MVIHNNSKTELGYSSAAQSGMHHPHISIRLEESELWRTFFEKTNEMIVTRSGRNMFPVLKVKMAGLDASAIYEVVVDFKQIDNHKWKYINGEWQQGTKPDPMQLKCEYKHPDSPNFGAHWMKDCISFNKVKLTNKPPSKGQIQLNSLHKYEPRIIVFKLNSNMREKIAEVNFHETQFIAVTAYQNEEITSLKIRHNPFAKAFLDVREKPEQSLTSEEYNSNNDELNLFNSSVTNYSYANTTQQTTTDSNWQARKSDVSYQPQSSYSLPNQAQHSWNAVSRHKTLSSHRSTPYSAVHTSQHSNQYPSAINSNQIVHSSPALNFSPGRLESRLPASPIAPSTSSLLSPESFLKTSTNSNSPLANIDATSLYSYEYWSSSSSSAAAAMKANESSSSPQSSASSSPGFNSALAQPYLFNPAASSPQQNSYPNETYQTTTSTTNSYWNPSLVSHNNYHHHQNHAYPSWQFAAAAAVAAANYPSHLRHQNAAYPTTDIHSSNHSFYSLDSAVYPQISNGKINSAPSAQFASAQPFVDVDSSVNNNNSSNNNDSGFDSPKAALTNTAENRQSPSSSSPSPKLASQDDSSLQINRRPSCWTSAC